MQLTTTPLIPYCLKKRTLNQTNIPLIRLNILLKYFIKTYKPNRIISYADNDWSVGNLYYKLGFTNVSVGRPDYKYIINGQRVHKGRYRKSKIGIKDLPITESEYTKSIGINRIYDCGKIKFELLM